MLEMGASVRSEDRFFFNEGVTKYWSCGVFTVSDIYSEILPSFHIEILHGRYNEALLKKPEITLKENQN